MNNKILRITQFVGVVVGASVLAAGFVQGGFTLKRPGGASLEKMREEYCAAQVSLLRQAAGLLADVAAAQEAMIGDMQAFVEGGAAPCGSASRPQLAEATKKTEFLAGQVSTMREKLRVYAGKIRLFMPDEEGAAPGQRA